MRLLLLLAPISLFGSITNVRVEMTHRQAVISYTAPGTAACTVDVYTDSARTLRVHDTNTAIFGAGANLDTRSGSLTFGRLRSFVVGQIPLPGWSGYTTTETTFTPLNISGIARAANVATVDTASAHGLYVNDHVTIAGVTNATFNATDVLVTAVVDADTFSYSNTGTDGSSGSGTVTRVNRYSRTLQVETQHWYTITCGGDTYEGTFTTKNLPLGSTYGETMAFDWSSAPMKYLYPAMPNVRGHTVIDPVTGVLARRSAAREDCSICGANDFPVSAAGNVVLCPQTKTNGGYHCFVRTQSSLNRAYWYGPDGESRYLGYLNVSAGAEWPAFYFSYQGMFDAGDPNTFYVLQTNTVLGGYGLLKVTYTGGAYGLDAEVPANQKLQAAVTNLTPSSAGKTITSLILDFDPSFPSTTYTNCILRSVQGDYLTGTCASRAQDSPAWAFAIDLGDRLPLGSCSDCLSVVAAAPVHGNPKTRWCGVHYSNYVVGGNVMHLIHQSLRGGGSTGPWRVTLQNAGGIDANATTLTVSGEPTPDPGGLPADGSTYLQDAEVGDLFQFEDTAEYIVIAQKNSPTEWVVTRGVGSTKVPHAQGAGIKAICPGLTPIAGMSGPDMFWSYLNDPHGTDATNTHWVKDPYIQNVHRVEREPWDVAGWTLRYGAFPANFRSPALFSINPSPRFAGIWTGCDGNSYQKHPSYENWNGGGQWANWFIDFLPFGIGVTNGDTVSRVAGTTQVYRNVSYGGITRDPKRAPYIGISARNILLDISGPANCSADPTNEHCVQDANSYRYCMAYKANECFAGSSPGDVYFSVPGVATVGCAAGEGYAGQTDICAMHTNIFGQSVAQLGLTPQRNAQMPAYSRPLIRGLMPVWRTSLQSAAHTTPDGRWLIFPTTAHMIGTLTDEAMFLAKVPSYPPVDNVNRTTFVPLPVKLGGMPGATKTVLDFGYDPEQTWRCTQRDEACMVVAGTFTEANPYALAESDDVSGGVDCSAGCTINIPAISGRVVYYRWRYRTGDGTVLGTSATQVLAAP